MKKILITGANSYIGTCFEKWMKKYDRYTVNTLDMLGDKWKSFDFSGYNTVFHVAGIAHIKETKENANLYYKVNRDLAVATAKKAKENGVEQFIYLSSMSVYGNGAEFITKESAENPTSNYGHSKLEAEKLVNKLSDSQYKVAIIRPPMVYGKNCKGNYQTLRKFAIKSPIFFRTDNRRSMIFIDNLCEFVYQIIRNNMDGIYLPQNADYVSTDKMVKQIARCHGHKILLLPCVGSVFSKLNFNFTNKVFGNLAYERYDYGFSYRTVSSFEESIEKSEN